MPSAPPCGISTSAVKWNDESRTLVRRASDLAVPGELLAARGQTGTRRNDPSRDRGVDRQDLVFVGLHPEQFFQFLEFIRMFGSDILILGAAPPPG
jgi:hypothetical protein